MSEGNLLPVLRAKGACIVREQTLCLIEPPFKKIRCFPKQFILYMWPRDLGVGVLVGMTGVGGGSLMTPLLILLFHVHPCDGGGHRPTLCEYHQDRW